MRVLVCILFVVCSFSTAAQESRQHEKDQYVIVPRDIVMPLIATQPDCPLQLEMATRLARIGGGGGNIYRLRNRSSKPVRNFRVSYLLGNGNGGSWGWENNVNRLVSPGEVVSDTLENRVEIVPLTESLRDQLELKGPMKTVIVYFVEWVEFADGSIYSDESAFKALKAYLEDMSNKADRASQHSGGRL
jgi:hypothetical protein